MKAIVRHPHFPAALAILVVLGLLALLTAWKLGVTPAAIKQWIQVTVDWLEQRPAMIFAAIVFLPAGPFPVSVLLLAAGVVYGERFGLFTAGAIALTAIVLNFSLTYWIARYPARRLVARLIRNFDVEIPRLPDHHVRRFTIVFRITPGLPFFLQNYILGIAEVPFRVYFVVSLLAQLVWTFGFVVSGGAIFEGEAGKAIAGICLLVVATLLTQALRKKLGAGEAGEQQAS